MTTRETARTPSGPRLLPATVEAVEAALADGTVPGLLDAVDSVEATGARLDTAAFTAAIRALRDWANDVLYLDMEVRNNYYAYSEGTTFTLWILLGITPDPAGDPLLGDSANSRDLCARVDAGDLYQRAFGNTPPRGGRDRLLGLLAAVGVVVNRMVDQTVTATPRASSTTTRPPRPSDPRSATCARSPAAPSPVTLTGSRTHA